MATRFNTQVGNGEYRLQFETDNKEYYLLMQSTARRCVDCGHMTNANRIRSMSDEELADVVANGVGCVLKAPHCMDIDCTPCILKWLKQPFEGE